MSGVTTPEEAFEQFRELLNSTQLNAHRRGVLTMWTIYRRPKDFPDSYVARMSEIDKGKTVLTPSIIEVNPTDDGLQALRRLFFECSLTRLSRSPADDPVIVEVWL